MATSHIDANATPSTDRRERVVAILIGFAPAFFFVVPLALGDVGEVITLVSCYTTPVCWIVSFFYICSPRAWPREPIGRGRIASHSRHRSSA